MLFKHNNICQAYLINPLVKISAFLQLDFCSAFVCGDFLFLFISEFIKYKRNISIDKCK